MKLYQLIAQKTRSHALLQREIESDGIESVRQVPIAKKLAYIRIKNEIAELHLTAALLAKKYHCLTSYGFHLRKALIYNPYLVPNLARNLRNKNSILPQMPSSFDGAISTLTTTRNAATFFAVGFVYALGGFLIWPAYERTIERGSHAATTYLKCLDDIPKKYSAEACLFIAIAYLNDQEYYLSLRHLFEADIRSTDILPEITNYYNHCINGLIDGDEEHELSKLKFLFSGLNIASADSHTHTTAATVVENINKIIEKVYSTADAGKNLSETIWKQDWDRWASSSNYGGSRTAAPRSEYCYQKNDFCQRISGLFEQPDDKYTLTIPENVRHFNKKFYQKYPSLEPNKSIFDCDYDYELLRALPNQLSNQISLIELAAYMTQFMALPEVYLKYVINSNDVAAENNNEIETYLYSLLNKEPGTEMHSLGDPQNHFILEEEHELSELILLHLDDNNHFDCEKLQQEFPAKYWLTIHSKINDDLNISFLPSHLKNPLIYLETFIKDHFSPLSQQATFFSQLINDDNNDDIPSLLNNSQLYTSYSIFKGNKIFLQMIEALHRLGAQKVKEFIVHYHAKKFNNVEMKTEKTQRNTPLPKKT